MAGNYISWVWKGLVVGWGVGGGGGGRGDCFIQLETTRIMPFFSPAHEITYIAGYLLWFDSLDFLFQLSTVAALFCRFLSGCCLAKSTLSRSISLAVCVTIYFWLIRSLVDPTSTDSIIVRGPLQFSRLLYFLGP